MQRFNPTYSGGDTPDLFSWRGPPPTLFPSQHMLSDLPIFSMLCSHCCLTTNLPGAQQHWNCLSDVKSRSGLANQCQWHWLRLCADKESILSHFSWNVVDYWLAVVTAIQSAFTVIIKDHIYLGCTGTRPPGEFGGLSPSNE